jgi:hypothetical protein
VRVELGVERLRGKRGRVLNRLVGTGFELFYL